MFTLENYHRKYGKHTFAVPRLGWFLLLELGAVFLSCTDIRNSISRYISHYHPLFDYFSPPFSTFPCRYLSMSEEIDKHVLRKYEIGPKVGKGAYGIVWKAVDRTTQKVSNKWDLFYVFCWS